MKHLVVLAVVLLAACPKPKPTTTAPTGGGGGAMLANNMADAPVNKPGTLELKPPCNENGYMKLDVAAGTAFTIEAKASAGTATVSVLNKDGGAAGDPIEVAADAAKSLSGTGQEGTTFVTVSETGACAGNTVTLTIK